MGSFGPGLTALMNACRIGNAESVRLLIDAGAHVNTRGYWGETALHYAALQPAASTAEVIGLLLDAGALVGFRSYDRLQTAFEIANEEGNAHAVEALGAPTDSADPGCVCKACGVVRPKKKLSTCTICKGRGLYVFYCDRACQKKDWKLHREEFPHSSSVSIAFDGVTQCAGYAHRPASKPCGLSF
mmetsp:Transcript_32798/g.75875  ORF Transcript_32798/g.75875 Transcript_32798/m.75875 type:complete len:186 (+) Transcript_32798:3-560(+)